MNDLMEKYDWLQAQCRNMEAYEKPKTKIEVLNTWKQEIEVLNKWKQEGRKTIKDKITWEKLRVTP